MVLAFYSAITGETAKLKSDASVFTIADGIVQHLLVDHLFTGGKFANVVGEEEGSVINITAAPYKVDDLTVPEDFYGIIETAKQALTELATEIDAEWYKDITVFIDPIDGTREFSTELGEQCSICIGFSDSLGKPVAGVVYRPITQPPTYAAGAASENYTDSVLHAPAELQNPKGLLTSNGGISPFIVALIKELSFDRVPSGGAGNKMLMLLEGKGAAYIQDRGVSRWDTSGAQAVLEANGGVLSKLTTFVNAKELSSYTYLKSADGLNLDFETDAASLTPYNSADKKAVKKGDAPRKGLHAEFAPYSNLCGLLAVNAGGLDRLDVFYDAIQVAKSVSEPAYD